MLQDTALVKNFNFQGRRPLTTRKKYFFYINLIIKKLLILRKLPTQSVPCCAFFKPPYKEKPLAFISFASLAFKKSIRSESIRLFAWFRCEGKETTAYHRKIKKIKLCHDPLGKALSLKLNYLPCLAPLLI